MEDDLQEIFDILTANGINPLEYDISKIETYVEHKYLSTDIKLLKESNIAEQLSYIKKSDRVEIYTDGSCIENDTKHPSTHAFVLVVNNKVLMEYSSHELVSTNNRAELMGLFKAIQLAQRINKKTKKPTMIFSDSKYSIGALTRWSTKWVKENDTKKKNMDIMTRYHNMLLGFNKKEIRVINSNVRWIKGHSDNKYNDMADELCLAEYDNINF